MNRYEPDGGSERFGSCAVRFAVPTGSAVHAGSGTRGEYTGFGTFGAESAENLYSPAPAAMQGNTEHVLSLYGGKETYFRYFFGEAISRVGGAGPGTRGSTGFGTFGA